METEIGIDAGGVKVIQLKRFFDGEDDRCERILSLMQYCIEDNKVEKIESYINSTKSSDIYEVASLFEKGTLYKGMMKFPFTIDAGVSSDQDKEVVLENSKNTSQISLVDALFFIAQQFSEIHDNLDIFDVVLSMKAAPTTASIGEHAKSISIDDSDITRVDFSREEIVARLMKIYLSIAKDSTLKNAEDRFVVTSFDSQFLLFHLHGENGIILVFLNENISIYSCDSESVIELESKLELVLSNVMIKLYETRRISSVQTSFLLCRKKDSPDNNYSINEEDPTLYMLECVARLKEEEDVYRITRLREKLINIRKLCENGSGELISSWSRQNDESATSIDKTKCSTSMHPALSKSRADEDILGFDSSRKSLDDFVIGYDKDNADEVTSLDAGDIRNSYSEGSDVDEEYISETDTETRVKVENGMGLEASEMKAVNYIATSKRDKENGLTFVEDSPNKSDSSFPNDVSNSNLNASAYDADEEDKDDEYSPSSKDNANEVKAVTKDNTLMDIDLTKSVVNELLESYEGENLIAYAQRAYMVSVKDRYYYLSDKLTIVFFLQFFQTIRNKYTEDEKYNLLKDPVEGEIGAEEDNDQEKERSTENIRNDSSHNDRESNVLLQHGSIIDKDIKQKTEYCEINKNDSADKSNGEMRTIQDMFQEERSQELFTEQECETHTKNKSSSDNRKVNSDSDSKVFEHVFSFANQNRKSFSHEKSHQNNDKQEGLIKLRKQLASNRIMIECEYYLKNLKKLTTQFKTRRKVSAFHLERTSNMDNEKNYYHQGDIEYHTDTSKRNSVNERSNINSDSVTRESIVQTSYRDLSGRERFEEDYLANDGDMMQPVDFQEELPPVLPLPA